MRAALWFVIGALAALVAAVSVVKGDEDHPGHPPQDQSLHDQFYSTWNRPDMRDDKGNRYASCCNKEDCYSTPMKNVGGTWLALKRETQQWVVVPNALIEQNQADTRESPDGQSHACINKYTNQVYCATIGSGM